MPIPPSPLPPLPCCVEGPAGFVPKARYAVETLLAGLGLAPGWTDCDGLAGGGLYYGSSPEAAPAAALRFRLDPATAAYFAGRAPFDPARMSTLDWGGTAWPLPFDGGDGRSVIEKDVVASTFFWLAGWTEWTTTARDVHGRFPFEGSLHDRLGLAAVPAVDAYRRWLGDRLRERGVPVPGRTWEGAPWAVALTVDIDFVRTRRLGRMARALARGRRGRALAAFAPGDARWGALLRLRDLAAGRAGGGTFFVKAGAAAPEDVPFRLEAPRLRRVLDAVRAAGGEVGLHPSYAAYDHPGRLGAERDRLAAVLGGAPRGVRTHYLRWIEPTTPRLLDRAGFVLDSTLGFSHREGFRRATAVPFRLYDLDANRPLDVWEVPLTVMDTTLFTHRGLRPDEADTAVAAVFSAAKRVGGCVVLLWHNDPEGGASPEGLAVLERALAAAEAEGAAVGGLERLLVGWCVSAT